jgi:hypothetical protein
MKTVQFVQIKLCFAGKSGNWRLAAYELNQSAPFSNKLQCALL